MRVVFSDFSETGPGALLRFLLFLEGEGYVVTFVEDFWPIHATHSSSQHVIRAKHVTSPLASRDMSGLTAASDESRVVLADFSANSDHWINLWPAQTKLVGIGIYDLNAGWVILPGTIRSDGLKKLRDYRIPHHTISETGDRLKLCTKCGEMKPLSAFYRKPRRERSAGDPFRSRCKLCYRSGA